MKEKSLKKMICILVVLSFLPPINIITIYNAKGYEKSNYLTVYREAESWDRSYDNLSGLNWNIFERTTFPAASNGYYTKQINGSDEGDYAEWDFTIYDSGNYRFLVRAWCNENGTNEVHLYWNDNLIDIRSFNSDTWNSWYWFDFPDENSVFLSSGIGTIKIISNESGLMELDNLLITDDPTFNPGYLHKGAEGSTTHDIGEKTEMAYYAPKYRKTQKKNMIVNE